MNQIRFIFVVQSQNHRTTMFYVLQNITICHKFQNILLSSLQTTEKSPRPQEQTFAEYCRCVLALEPTLVIWKHVDWSWWSENYHCDIWNGIIYCLGICVWFKHAWLSSFCCQPCSLIMKLKSDMGGSAPNVGRTDPHLLNKANASSPILHSNPTAGSPRLNLIGRSDCRNKNSNYKRSWTLLISGLRVTGYQLIYRQFGSW